MKALILAGGNGKRLKEKTFEINKCMLQVNGRYLIEYSLESAYRNADEIVILVGYRSEQIILAFGYEYKGKKISYVLQSEQKGMVNAIECSRDEIGSSDFMIFLGDEVLIKSRHGDMLKKYKDEKLFGICGVAEVDDKEHIKKTYSISVGTEDTIQKLIEKPESPFNNFMGTGNCVFSNRFFEYIEKTPLSTSSYERTFPDVIQTAVDFGERVKHFVLCDKYFNINYINDFVIAEDLFRTGGDNNV